MLVTTMIMTRDIEKLTVEYLSQRVKLVDHYKQLVDKYF
jgi:hypothetical protein